MHIGECHLLPRILEELKVLEYDFRHNELGLSVVVSIHVSSFACDISDAVIECSSQVLQILQ